MRHLFLFAFSICFGSQLYAATFELIDSQGFVTGFAETNNNSVRFRELTGQHSVYLRDRRYDSQDRSFAGYFNVVLNRALRFPRSGTGPIYTIDFDDFNPVYRPTRSYLRPVNRFARRPLPLVAGPTTGFHLHPTGYLSRPRGYRRHARSFLLDSRYIPHQPLPPATLNLQNGSSREIQVTLTDLRGKKSPQSFRISPGGSKQVKIERESGGKLHRRYQGYDLHGFPIEQSVVTEVPPEPRHEIVVHQWAVQSVAIDRTGTSPNAIEDINMQGRGIGRFILPPGDQLQSGTVDVYASALASQNPGSVAPIVPEKNKQRDNASRLEDAIIRAQQQALQRRP